jgi:hypothetical protein
MVRTMQFVGWVADTVVDVIMMYAFGRHYHCLEQSDFDAAGHEARHTGASSGNLMKHMYFVLWTIRRLPDSVVRRMSVALATFVRMKAVSYSIFHRIESVLTLL